MPDDMQWYIVENTARLILKSGMSLIDAVSDAVGFAIFNEFWEPYAGEFAAIPTLMPVEGEFASEAVAMAMRKAVAARLIDDDVVDHAASTYCSELLYHADRASACWQIRDRLEQATAEPGMESRMEAIRLLNDENFRLAEKLQYARQLLRACGKAPRVDDQAPEVSPRCPGDEERLLEYVFEDRPT